MIELSLSFTGTPHQLTVFVLYRWHPVKEWAALLCEGLLGSGCNLQHVQPLKVLNKNVSCSNLRALRLVLWGSKMRVYLIAKMNSLSKFHGISSAYYCVWSGYHALRVAQRGELVEWSNRKEFIWEAWTWYTRQLLLRKSMSIGIDEWWQTQKLFRVSTRRHTYSHTVRTGACQSRRDQHSCLIIRGYIASNFIAVRGRTYAISHYTSSLTKRQRSDSTSHLGVNTRYIDAAVCLQVCLGWNTSFPGDCRISAQCFCL